MTLAKSSFIFGRSASFDSMDPECNHPSFPESTLFYRLDGVLFAVMADDRYVGADDKDMLITLSKPYAEELARMVDLWEFIDESEFRAGLAPGWRMPLESKSSQHE